MQKVSLIKKWGIPAAMLTAALALTLSPTKAEDTSPTPESIGHVYDGRLAGPSDAVMRFILSTRKMISSFSKGAKEDQRIQEAAKSQIETPIFDILKNIKEMSGGKFVCNSTIYDGGQTIISTPLKLPSGEPFIILMDHGSAPLLGHGFVATTEAAEKELGIKGANGIITFVVRAATDQGFISPQQAKTLIPGVPPAPAAAATGQANTCG